jgi:hypothetical protein
MTATKININDLTNVGDLIFFDGPLMSLFMDKQKSRFFIFDWVKTNEQFNQWIAYQVPLSYVADFMEGALSHRDLLRNSLKNEFILIDIDDDLNYFQLQFLRFEELPSSYLPQENTYFSIKDCPDFSTIQKQIQLIPRKKRLKELAPFA